MKDITKDSADQNRPVGIAFLDTGANINHDILMNLIRDSRNFVTDRQDGSESKAFLCRVESLIFMKLLISVIPFRNIILALLISATFRQHSEFDLLKDYYNHGSMVAGLLAKYGPNRMYLLNYKVTVIMLIMFINIHLQKFLLLEGILFLIKLS